VAMLKHLVLLKFKESVTDEQKDDLEKSLLALPKVIKEIKGYECGSDLRPIKTFDFALVSTFDDFAAMKIYQVHPDHVNVLTKVRNLSVRIEAVDFEF
jgi:heme-degrading monooxygenase HmoA